ncbi:MAG: carboxymuconolactone decarboxylase family protein [Desulfosalsimonas sp.]
MPRIPYFDLSEADEEIRKAVESRPALNIYRMLAHAGPAAAGFLKLGSALLRENKLDTLLRELAIIRVGILCRASYEVYQHERIARREGLAEEKIEVLRDGPDSPVFTDIEKKVLRYTDSVVLNVKAGESTFRALEQIMSHRELAELTLTIGFYMMVSRFLENFEVEIEDEPAPV